ncbi:hypothetical protein LSAT2_010673 [Lamellibrachia satsuma]|nr:hypothetical protein LSAT2_010673 [Lamellibrachia satsuma]
MKIKRGRATGIDEVRVEMLVMAEPVGVRGIRPATSFGEIPIKGPQRMFLRRYVRVNHKTPVENVVTLLKTKWNLCVLKLIVFLEEDNPQDSPQDNSFKKNLHSALACTGKTDKRYQS